jgi:large subunit ribosomal protein L9
MSKTEVILIKNVVGLGAESDHVSVTSGYARNFLIPGGLAVPVTQGNRKWIENLKKRRSDRETHELNSMSELAKSLNKVTLNLLVKTGEDGKMFGSVTSGTIADALKTQLDVSLEKRKIHLEKPIQALGEQDVELRLHPEVRCSLKVVVKSLNPLPEIVVPAEKEVQKTEKRGKRAAAEEAPAEAPAKGAKGGKK